MAEPRRLIELETEVAGAADLPDGRLVVGLSGGADSAALLWLCRRQEREVRAVHVHHGLAASDALAGAAAAIAETLATPLVVKRVTLGAGASPENQAREVRYRALSEGVEEGEWVLTAHTLDDQAETVLDHLLRASGPDGLRGIPARRPPFARPFLDVTRSRTRELASLAGLAWLDDPANQTLDPLRNRIRRHLIPELEAEYNPRLRRSLATTARLVAADVDHLESTLEAPIERRGASTAIAASVLTTAADSPATRLTRRFLAAAGLAAASPEAVAGVLAVARGEVRRHHPGGSLTVRRRGAMVVAEPAGEASPDSVDLAMGGATVFGTWTFDSFVTGTAPVAMPLGAEWMVADRDAVGALSVEPARRHRSALEYLAGAGVPVEDRPHHPVLVGVDGPVWIPYVRRLGSGWADDRTDRYLVVRTRVERTWQR